MVRWAAICLTSRLWELRRRESARRRRWRYPQRTGTEPHYRRGYASTRCNCRCCPYSHVACWVRHFEAGDLNDGTAAVGLTNHATARGRFTNHGNALHRSDHRPNHNPAEDLWLSRPVGEFRHSDRWIRHGPRRLSERSVSRTPSYG